MAQALTGILGAGAMGQLLAHELALAEQPVTLLRRPGETACTATHCFEPLSGDLQYRQLPHHPADHPLPLDGVLVLTKAYQSLDALAPLVAWLPSQVPVVLLHNGLGPQLEAQARWPRQPFWAGSLSDGALALGRHRIRHTGPGQRWVGRLGKDAPLPPVLTTLNFAHHNAPHLALWQKLTVNLVINPITARDRVPNGALLSEDYRAEVEALCHEAALVGQAQGFAEAASTLLDRALTVAEATRHNRSSMLQDVEAGRTTELDAITGYLLDQARALGIPCPTHRALYRALTFGH